MKTKYPGVYSDETSKTYYVSFYYSSLKSKRKKRKFKRGFSTLDEALAFKLSYSSKPIVNTTFKNVALDYLSEIRANKKIGTYKNYLQVYRCHIAPFFDDLKINDITFKDVQGWKLEMLELKMSDSVNERAYTLLGSILNHGIKFFGLKNNVVTLAGPFKKIGLNKQSKRVISMKEFQIFFKVLENNLDKVIFSLLFFGGYRFGELLALTWEDIDLTNNVIAINYNFDKFTRTRSSTKNARGVRKTKISNFVKSLLLDMYNETSKRKDFSSGDYVISHDGKKPIPRTNLTRIKDRYIDKAGLEYFTIKDFRYSKDSNSIKYVSNMEDLFALADSSGHTKEVMLQYYLSNNLDSQNKFVDALEKEFLGTK